jgi:hypothetical protein
MASDRDLLNAGATMALDSFTAELVTELGASGLASIVLKGPAVARLLYQTGELRFHDDVDLLVRKADLPEIRRVLRGRGFDHAADAESGEVWARARDGVVVDLHTNLVGIAASTEEAWDVLSRHQSDLVLGSALARTLTPAGIALHVALHAAQHGAGTGRSLRDLDRALAAFDRQTWTAAAALARELEAAGAMAIGLRLLPQGASLAAELDLPDDSSTILALRAGTAPLTALGFYRLLVTPGIRGKAALLGRELFPEPAFMRQMYAVARHGRVGLLAAYAWRPVWLLLHAGPALAAIKRARRTGR